MGICDCDISCFQDLLLSILSSVLVPFPSGNCHEASQNVLSGVTYGSAMVGFLVEILACLKIFYFSGKFDI